MIKHLEGGLMLFTMLLTILLILLPVQAVEYAQGSEYELLWSYYTGDYISDVTISSDGLHIAAISGAVVYLLDWDGDLLWSYDTGDYYLSEVIISPDEPYVGAISGTTIYIFDWDGYLLGTEVIEAYDIDDYYLYSGDTVSSAGSYVISSETEVYLYDWTGDCLWSYDPGSFVHSVSISPDGSYIAAGCDNGSIYFFGHSGVMTGITAYPTPTIHPTQDYEEILGIISMFFPLIVPIVVIWFFYKLGKRRIKSEHGRRGLEKPGPEPPFGPESDSSSPLTPAPTPLHTSIFPVELKDTYQDAELIGRGGFARVFRARRKHDGKIVAIKIPISLDEATGRSFLKEIRVWEELKHPNIVELYGMNIMPIPYFEMEYLDGGCLEAIKKPLDVRKAVEIIRDIAEGLRYAHEKGVIHRDLKPQNILLRRDLTPKISDWGLSKVMAQSKTTTVVGFSPVYAAPEQVSPKQFGGADERTDMWQLGVIFYELLTGRLPFDGESVVEVSNAILTEAPLPPSSLNPEANAFDEIVLRSLSKEKADRFRDVEAFLKELTIAERRVKLAEELKKTLREEKNFLKKSISPDGIRRSNRMIAETLGRLAVIYAESGEKVELLNTLEDLKFYTKEEQNIKELSRAIEQLELVIKNQNELSDRFVSGIMNLVHRIKREWEV